MLKNACNPAQFRLEIALAIAEAVAGHPKANLQAT